MTGLAASRAVPAVWDVVERILQTRHPVAVAVTGGGSLAVSWLLNHPGASRAIVDAHIPYCAAAIADYLGAAGPHRVEEETARRLARRARQRAVTFSHDEGALGAGATAALATDRERRGEDRAFIAVRSAGTYHFRELRFAKASADRLEQEDLLSAELVAALAEAAGTGTAQPPPRPPWATVRCLTAPVDEGIEALLGGEVEVLELAQPGDRARADVDRGNRLLMPGSFNPFHEGHAGLAAAAEARSGRRAAFELAVANVDKPPLPYRQILERAAQPRGGRPLILSREPTFLGKARLFPGCWFAIGYDTAVRLVDPSYYGGAQQLERALSELGELACRFLVAGRHWQGEYRALAQVPVPAGHESLLEEIGEAEFRADTSSTELRSQRRGDR